MNKFNTLEEKTAFIEEGKRRPLSKEERKVVRAFLRKVNQIPCDEDKLFFELDNGEKLIGFKVGFIKSYIVKYGFEGAMYNMYPTLSAWLVEKGFENNTITSFNIERANESLELIFDIISNILSK